MPTLQGNFEDQYDATMDDVTIQGALSGGVIVRRGVHLTVQGAVSGDVILEDDSGLTAYGSFLGDIVSNEGLILIAGQTEWSSFREGNGTVVLAISSVITGDGVEVLGPDGALYPVQPDEKLNVHAEAKHYCYWHAIEERFIPLSEMPTPS